MKRECVSPRAPGSAGRAGNRAGHEGCGGPRGGPETARSARGLGVHGRPGGVRCGPAQVRSADPGEHRPEAEGPGAAPREPGRRRTQGPVSAGGTVVTHRSILCAGPRLSPRWLKSKPGGERPVRRQSGALTSFLSVRGVGRAQPGGCNLPHGHCGHGGREWTRTRCGFCKHPLLFSGAVGSPLGLRSCSSALDRLSVRRVVRPPRRGSVCSLLAGDWSSTGSAEEPGGPRETQLCPSGAPPPPHQHVVDPVSLQCGSSWKQEAKRMCLSGKVFVWRKLCLSPLGGRKIHG